MAALGRWSARRPLITARAVAPLLAAGALFTVGCGYQVALQPTVTPAAGGAPAAALGVRTLAPSTVGRAPAAPVETVQTQPVDPQTLLAQLTRTDGSAVAASAPATNAATLAAVPATSATTPSVAPAAPPAPVSPLVAALAPEPITARNASSAPAVTPTRTPTATATATPRGAPALPTRAPTRAATSTPLPSFTPSATRGPSLAEIAQLSPRTATPVATPATPRPATATATATPPPAIPTTTARPSQSQTVRVSLPEGISDFLYVGATAPIDQALASLAGSYDTVWFRPSAGAAEIAYRPGGAAPTLPSGTLVRIGMRRAMSFTMQPQ